MNPNPTVPGNWDADVFFYPHPYLIGAVRTVDAGGEIVNSGILNSQVAGADHVAKANTFTSMVERYRLGYMSVTGYHNASAVANNGLLAAAQYMATPNIVTAAVVSAVPGTVGYIGAQPQCELWPDNLRTFENLQSTPNSYVGPAREGVYCPFRITETCQDWKNGSMRRQSLGRAVSSSFENAFIANPNVTEFKSLNAKPDLPYGFVDSYHKAYVHERSGEGVIHISLRQIAQDASFMFYYRGGWEYQVAPSTTLISFARTSPQYDPMALATYFKISRELKDGYPADYNDLGKILSVIKDAAKSVLPLASKIFPVLRPVSALVSGPSPQKKTTRSPMGVSEPVPDLMSSAQRERVQQAMSAPRAQHMPARNPAPQKANKRM